MVSPNGVALKLLGASEHPPAAVFVAQKDSGQAIGDFAMPCSPTAHPMRA
jgi:hypothetical protein